MSRIKKGIFSKRTNNRSKHIYVIFMIVYSFLILRIIDITLYKGEQYSSVVESQSTEKITLNSGRGVIYDRNNIALTDTVKQKILLVPREVLSGEYENINLIKKATNLNDEEIFKAVQNQLSSKIVKIEIEELNKDMEDDLLKKEIIVETKTLRYSNNNLLSHTIGYLKKSDGTPQSGIEKSMNDVLNDNNSEYISVFKASTNSKGLDILEGSIETIRDNEDDEHLRLTIDSKIQKIIEDIVDEEKNPTAVLISDIESGEILAMSSRPNYNQNNIVDYINSDNRELENRTISVTYPPGSIFKIVVLYSALYNKVIDDNTYMYNCTGESKVGNTDEILKCHNKDGHGTQTIEQAFANSCNTAFLDIAMKTGKENILESIDILKLNEKVDIGLDEEKSSNIPNNISIRNLAIGQADIEFTPLQINQLTQIIANNGTYKPLLLYDSIIDNDKNIIKTFRSTKEDEIISPYIITKIKEIMKSVSEIGTAKDLNDLDGGCGVKTGTAQSNLDGVSISHGWITGFYPNQNPEYAITVLVEGTKEESKSAIPIFKSICSQIYKNK